MHLHRFANAVLHGSPAVRVMPLQVALKKLPDNQRKTITWLMKNTGVVGVTEEDAGFISACH